MRKTKFTEQDLTKNFDKDFKRYILRLKEYAKAREVVIEAAKKWRHNRILGDLKLTHDLINAVDKLNKLEEKSK